MLRDIVYSFACKNRVCVFLFLSGTGKGHYSFFNLFWEQKLFWGEEKRRMDTCSHPLSPHLFTAISSFITALNPIPPHKCPHLQPAEFYFKSLYFSHLKKR